MHWRWYLDSKSNGEDFGDIWKYLELITLDLSHKKLMTMMMKNMNILIQMWWSSSSWLDHEKGVGGHTQLHSDVNPTGLALWIFFLFHVIVTETWSFQ